MTVQANTQPTDVATDPHRTEKGGPSKAVKTRTIGPKYITREPRLRRHPIASG